MSKITTRSVFYYGLTVRLDNRSLDFSEGGPPLIALLKVGDYTLTEFVDEVERALNEAGALVYTVTLNRTTRVITISASGVFSILTASGPTVGQNIFPLLGFNSPDKTGASAYAGDAGAGYEYQTQYPVSEYEGKEHSIVLENGAYNVTPIGTAQVASFGDGSRVS